MTGKQLKNSILQWAIQGKLVPPACRQAGKTLMMNPLPRIAGQKAWFTYVIECEDGSFYKGYTDNLIRRYKQHCDGKGAEYTKTHKPKQLFYWEMHYSEEEALAREKYLKSGVGREWFKREVVEKPENWEPASVLLERIRAEKARLVKEGKIKKDKNESIIYRGMPDGQAGDDNSYYEKFADGTVVCIDDEIPFDVPKGWVWCRISDIATIVGGYAYKSHDFISSSPNQVLRLGNIKNDFLKVDASPVYISDDLAIKTDKFRCHLDDILVTMTGTRKKRDYFFSYKVKSINHNCFINQRVGAIRFYIKEMSNYMIYALKAETILHDVFQYETGTANQGNLGSENIAKVLIPLPPFAEQYRIADKIQELLPVVEQFSNAQLKLDNLNKDVKPSLLKSILQEVIQGKLVPQDPNDEPASVLLQRIKEEKQRLVKEGNLKKKDVIDSVIYKNDDNKYFEKNGKGVTCIDEEIPFEIPQGWEWTRLSVISDIYTGNSISETEKRTKYTDVAGRYYIGTKDVSFDNNIMYNNGVAIPKKYESNFRIAPNNSVLMCIEGGSAGRKIAVLNQDVCFGNKLCCFSPFVNITRYIFYYLQSPIFLDMFNDNKTGIIGGVSIAKVKDILIPIPPRQEIERIVNKLDNVVSSIMSRKASKQRI